MAWIDKPINQCYIFHHKHHLEKPRFVNSVWDNDMQPRKDWVAVGYWSVKNGKIAYQEYLQQYKETIWELQFAEAQLKELSTPKSIADRIIIASKKGNKQLVKELSEELSLSIEIPFW